MESGAQITEGDLWRGIGLRKQRPDVGSLYDLSDEGSRVVAVFTVESFFDPVERHPDGSGQMTQEPSVLVAVMAGQPTGALALLKEAGRRAEAIAGLSVLAIYAGTGRMSPGGPTKSAGTPSPMMVVVYDPVVVTNRETNVQVRLDAHAVVRPDPRWHSSQGPLKAMRRALAALATEYHRVHGWVLAPTS